MPDRTPARSQLRSRFLDGRHLVSHFLAYCAGVCLFAMINMFFGGSAWFQWPSLIWGILLVAHVFTVVARDARGPSLDG
jgi:hypothetical protein